MRAGGWTSRTWDDIRLEAIEVGPGPHDNRFHTSQPHVEGESPSQDSLVAWLESWGFRHMKEHRIGAYDAVCCRRGSIWLFDVRPMNFVLGAHDACVPIDVIIQDDGDVFDAE